MSSSARNRSIVPGVITVTRNIDDFKYAVFSNIVYPQDIGNNLSAYIDGSDVVNITVANGIPTPNGGDPIESSIFIQDSIIFNDIITYPTA